MSHATASLDEIRAWVGERMKGSPEPVALHFVTCWHSRHSELRSDGGFCVVHVGAAAVAQGFDAACFDTLNSYEHADAPKWCDTCGVPLIGKLDASEVDDELCNWESKGPLNAPVEWREFSLCLVDPPEAEIPRIRAVIARALTAGVTS